MTTFLNKSNKIIGMVHLLPLPGSPGFGGSIQNIIDSACREAEVYAKYEVGGVLIENMHDIPYVKSKYLGPETVASMTRVCSVIRNIIPPAVPCGVQVLAAGNEEAIAVALASNCNFVRVEGFVFGHVADEGYIDSCAGTLLRYRTKIKAQNVSIFADIKKKHSSHSITADTSIEEVAKAAEFFLSDGIIITGSATGEEASVEELKRVKKAVKLPVIIGSGITEKNIQKFADADAVIVGSSLKYHGRWQNPIDENRLRVLLDSYSRSNYHIENIQYLESYNSFAHTHLLHLHICSRKTKLQYY